MYLIGPADTRIWTDSNRNFTLREYGRLEYGTSEIGWLLASERPRRTPKKASRRLSVRLRYFLNSFRGFAAFDLMDRDQTGH